MTEEKGKSAARFTAIFGLLLLLVPLLSGCSGETLDENEYDSYACPAFTPEPAGTAGQAQLIKILTEPTKSVHALAWSANGSLAVAAWHVYVYNKELCLIKVLQIPWGALVDVAWSPDGRLAILSRSRLDLYDQTLQAIESFEVGPQAQDTFGRTITQLTSLDWFQDGRLAVSSTDHRVYVYSQADLPTVWSPDSDENKKAPMVLRDSPADIAEISWSPDGWLAAGIWDHTIRIYDQDLQGLRLLEDPTDWVTAVDWALDGRLAAGSLDKLVYVYDKELKLMAKLSACASVLDPPPAWLSWSRDGRLAVSCNNHKVYTYDKELQVASTFDKSRIRIKSVAWDRSLSGPGRLAAGSVAQTYYRDDSGACGDGCKVFIYEAGCGVAG